MMNKKGSLLDTIYLPAYIMVLAMTIFIGFYVWTAFHTSFTTTVDNSVGQGLISADQNATIQTAMNNIDVSINAFDYTFPILVIGLMLVSLVFAFKSGAGVMYSVVSVVLWAFAVFFSMIFSNIFTQFALSFPTEGAQFTIISWIMTNLKWVTLGWVFLISVVMFTQNKKENSGMVNYYGGGAYNG